MIIGTIVHALEAAVVLLFLLMAYQISKCYRAFYAPETSVKKVEATASSEALSDSDHNSAEMANPQPEIVPQEAANDVVQSKKSVENAASSAILNDYIGGFFSEEPSLDLQAYKAESEDDRDEVLVDKVAEPAAVSVTQAQLDSFKVPETIEPVLVNPVRVVDLDEEDTFIVVEDENVHCHNSQESVMSDKVVHAMLKEAKMVASS